MEAALSSKTVLVKATNTTSLTGTCPRANFFHDFLAWDCITRRLEQHENCKCWEGGLQNGVLQAGGWMFDSEAGVWNHSLTMGAKHNLPVRTARSGAFVLAYGIWHWLQHTIVS